MFRSLYAKLLIVFMAVMLTAMSLLSVLLYQRIREDKMEARIKELTIQAQDVAYLAAQIGSYAAQEMNDYFLWKTEQIRQGYDASVFIFDENMREIPIEDDMFAYSAETVNDLETLKIRLSAGQDVSRRSIEAETGNPVYTVGAPYVQNGEVRAAVLIHTSEQSVESSYREIVVETAKAMVIVLALGAVLILVLCQFISRPMRAMARAAERFALGDFEQRVKVQTKDEVGRLAEAFNSMASDLDQLEQTRREFVANVSHELRSPLTSIQGFINGMLDGTVPEGEREHYLGIVLDETRRLNKLINTLLDLSHIESGQSPLNKSKFDINELICRVLIRQEGRIDEKHLEVDLRFEQESQKVNADPDRIEQVLINLIDNAVKYVSEGGQIRMETRAEGAKVFIAVEDNGPGVSPEDLQHIFDRFYKTDKAHTTGGGTGLGLAIVKGIIDQHEQRISASSEPGHGTRFEFSLDGVY